MMQDDWVNAVRREPKNQAQTFTKAWIGKGYSTWSYTLC